MKHLTTVPFSGFYYSLHDDEIDATLNQMFSDRDTGFHVYEGLVMAAWSRIDWHAVHTAYAKEYCENFSLWLELGLEFESMTSPKEYNFHSDRIFGFITTETLLKVYAKVDKSVLRAIAKERHTSRDGFSSFYDPDIKTWGPVETWDHNQIGTLLIALANDTLGKAFDQWAELDLMESDRCNGVIDDLICKNMPNADRLFKIFDYLEKRKEREGAAA